jgi:hypothetical protein
VTLDRGGPPRLYLGGSTTMKLLDMYRAWRAVRTAPQGRPAVTSPAPAPAPPAPPAPVAAPPAPPPAGSGIDGRWHCTMDTPMGEQAVMLTLSTAGGELSGDAQSPFGSQSFTGGTVAGHAVAWHISVTSPMAVELDFRATIQGDVLDGVVVAGPFGESAFSGVRV